MWVVKKVEILVLEIMFLGVLQIILNVDFQGWNQVSINKRRGSYVMKTRVMRKLAKVRH
jgi:hypothetical protein